MDKIFMAATYGLNTNEKLQDEIFRNSNQL